MPAPTQAAVRLAMRTMHAAGDVRIGYRRGEVTLAIDATPGKSRFEVESEESGQLIEIESRDWLITAALLSPGRDRRWLPKAGDEIFRDKDGVRTVWIVGQPTDGVPAFRFRDPEGEELRVHTIDERTEIAA